MCRLTTSGLGHWGRRSRAAGDVSPPDVSPAESVALTRERGGLVMPWGNIELAEELPDAAFDLVADLADGLAFAHRFDGDGVHLLQASPGKQPGKPAAPPTSRATGGLLMGGESSRTAVTVSVCGPAMWAFSSPWWVGTAPIDEVRAGNGDRVDMATARVKGRRRDLRFCSSRR
jgi:hypothetical protein